MKSAIIAFLLLSAVFAQMPLEVELNGNNLQEREEIEISEQNSIKISIKEAPIEILWYKIEVEPKNFEEIARIFGVELEDEPNLTIYEPIEFEKNFSIPKDFCGKINVNANFKIKANESITSYSLNKTFVKECKTFKSRILSFIARIIPLSFIAKLLG